MDIQVLNSALLPWMALITQGLFLVLAFIGVLFGLWFSITAVRDITQIRRSRKQIDDAIERLSSSETGRD